MAVARETIGEDIWRTVFEQLKTISRASWYSAFPDATVKGKSDYPICLLSLAEVSISDYAINKSRAFAEASLLIEIYATSARDVDEIADLIREKLNSSRQALWQNGLYVRNLSAARSSTFFRNELKVHYLAMRLSVKCFYNRGV